MARESKTLEADPYEGLRTRAHWKRSAASRVLKDCARSGEALATFARRHGLGAERLRRWHRLLSNTAVQRAQRSGPLRAPVVVKAPAPLVALEHVSRPFPGPYPLHEAV